MPLIVHLAGFNLDAELVASAVDTLRVLEEWCDRRAGDAGGADEGKVALEAAVARARAAGGADSFTPETLSAAYARISRDPKAVTEIRRAARASVARSRKSNENIIFGMGHASVAEHACFNFDILGLSRLATEELQSHRLVSFTEKSQRYVKLSTEYVVPGEIRGTPLEEEFHKVAGHLFEAYESLCTGLLEHFRTTGPDAQSGSDDRDLEGMAKEDARYLLPLACTTQMGMTLNARTLEYVVREFLAHPLTEVRDLGRALLETALGLAPSLVRYTARGSYPRRNRAALEGLLSTRGTAPLATADNVRLLSATPNGEQAILQGLAFSAGSTLPATPERAPSSVRTGEIWREIFRGMTAHEGVPREFELATLTYEADVSASCYAQLKRHRMMTLLRRPYEIASGAVCPPSLEQAHLTDIFTRALDLSHAAAAELGREHPLLLPYLLPNAQRRRVLIHVNVRELYHFARLRCDAHAQWEIRALADKMVEQARDLWPQALALACGKDRFEELYRSLFAP